jgi:protease IV
VSRRPVLTTLVIAVVSLMTLLGLVLAVATAVSGGPRILLGGRIAVLDIDGFIGDDQQLLRHLRRFRDNASVRGYLVQINSPGGEVAPAQSIHRELQRIRTEDGVPVVASIAGVGASGGYYIALAADSIFALPGSITGSIGVLMEIPDASELMSRVGVRLETVMSAEHKDLGSPFRPLGPGEREILDALVMDVYEQFVEVVAEARGLERDAVARIADGRILSGRQAQAARLVDRLGNREDALAAAGVMAGLGDRPRTITPPRPRTTLLDLLIGRGAAGLITRILAPVPTGAAPRLKYVVP